MKKSKSKLIVAALGGALAFSFIGGVSSVINNSGKGEFAQAAIAQSSTEKTRQQIIDIIKGRFPNCIITKLKKDWDDGWYDWEAKIIYGGHKIELEITSDGYIYDVDYDD